MVLNDKWLTKKYQSQIVKDCELYNQILIIKFPGETAVLQLQFIEQCYT